MIENAEQLLNEVADKMEVLTAEWMASYRNLIQVSTKFADYEAHVKLTIDVVSAMRPLVVEVARITQNAQSTIQMCYAPRDEISVWFNNSNPAQFIRNVAKYRSFNEEYWRSKGWKPQ